MKVANFWTTNYKDQSERQAFPNPFGYFKL